PSSPLTRRRLNQSQSELPIPGTGAPGAVPGSLPGGMLVSGPGSESVSTSPPVTRRRLKQAQDNNTAAPLATSLAAAPGGPHAAPSVAPGPYDQPLAAPGLVAPPPVTPQPTGPYGTPATAQYSIDQTQPLEPSQAEFLGVGTSQPETSAGPGLPRQESASGNQDDPGVPVWAAPQDQETESWGSVAPAAWKSVPSGTKPKEEEKRRKRRPIAFLIGLVGELLITLGVLLALYVVWELFWTTWETNNQVRQQVSELRTQPEWQHPSIRPQTDQSDGFAPQHQGAPGFQCGITVPENEGLMGIMHVPRWGADYQYPVHEGTDRVRILNQGWIGHYSDTQKPGEVGNFATSAHRTTYGAPYNRVQDLQIGDLAIFESEGCYLVYKMVGAPEMPLLNPIAVSPQQYSVVWPVPSPDESTEDQIPTKRMMTFTTCHPPFSAAERFIVWFEMQYWTDKSEGPLRVLSEPVEGG
ncbi:MAG: class E sortase, partial [Micrococcales bacterium]|nr:class E sortase [Micrococcales bacterium]